MQTQHDAPQDDRRPHFEALLPPQMARRAEEIGAAKSRQAAATLFALAVLAGAFVALGAQFSLVASTGVADHGYGVTRLLAGVTFSLGLILVVVAGAELFTGNNLIVMAWAGGRVTSGALLRHWALAYVGNFVGAVATAWLMFVGGLHGSDGGRVGAVALEVAEGKCALGFAEAFVRGVLCNALVCLAVWLSLSARTTTDRILCVIPPVTAFVACGFEHSIANMYFLPYALFVKNGADAAYLTSIGFGAAHYEAFTWLGFAGNLLPVTLGNILGGSVLVGLVYWFVYRRASR